MRLSLLRCVWVWLLIISGACLDPYKPHEVTQNLRYLVVDGFLNIVDSTCVVNLSRTMELDTSTVVPKERSAQVEVISETGETKKLVESAPGVYTGSKIAVDPLLKYHLSILTNDGKAYASNPIAVIATPPIDSVSWKVSGSHLSIYVNTHGADRDVGYYQWKFSETWEYHARYVVNYVEQSPGVIVPTSGDTIYYCYQNNNPEGIQIGATARLQNNLISEFTLRSLDLSSYLLELRYSILVQQRALTEDAYNYLEQLKNTTEGLGTLFDPLPSTVTGNVHNLSNSNEPVPGYFSIGSIQTKRLFITKQQSDPQQKVVTVTPFDYCSLTPIAFYDGMGKAITPPPSLKGLNIILPQLNKKGLVIGWYIASEDCVDCRSIGGTLSKPLFW